MKQYKVTFNHRKEVNIYIAYEVTVLVNISKYKYSSNGNHLTLKNALFGAVSLTKNADIDKYKYSRYGIEFDRRASFSLPSGGNGQNVITFGVVKSSSTKIDNRKKYILILGKGPRQGSEHTLTAEKMYSINFSKGQTKFCLSLHYNGANSYLFVNGTEIHKFKAKDSEIETFQKTGQYMIYKNEFNGYVYDFSVNYDAIPDIAEI